MTEAPRSGSNTVSLDVAAALLKCTPRWIQQLAKDGYITKANRGQYPLVGLIHGYIDFRDSEDRRSTKTAADSRVKDRRADLLDVQLAERTGKLKADAVSEAMALIDIVIGGLQADLMSVPARVTADLQIRKKIETAIDDTFRAAADRAGREVEGLEEGESLSDATESDDA